MRSQRDFDGILKFVCLALLATGAVVGTAVTLTVLWLMK